MGFDLSAFKNYRFFNFWVLHDRRNIRIEIQLKIFWSEDPRLGFMVAFQGLPMSVWQIFGEIVEKRFPSNLTCSLESDHKSNQTLAQPYYQAKSLTPILYKSEIGSFQGALQAILRRKGINKLCKLARFVKSWLNDWKTMDLLKVRLSVSILWSVFGSFNI